jgi:hypothetical protein
MQFNPSGGFEKPRVVKIFVAYDRPDAGVHAEKLCADLEAADEFSFEVQPWRANPKTASESHVRAAARPADIMVLAWADPVGPPEYLFQWVLDWAVSREVINATLAALPVGDTVVGEAKPVIQRMRQMASAASLVFVCDWSNGLKYRAAGLSQELQEREQIVTPTLAAILAAQHAEPHLEWGLNE